MERERFWAAERGRGLGLGRDLRVELRAVRAARRVARGEGCGLVARR